MMMDINDKLLQRHVREYVDNVECSCAGDNTFSCWKCCFEFDLRYIDSGKAKADDELIPPTLPVKYKN
jgi:hypothetical protein